MPPLVLVKCIDAVTSMGTFAQSCQMLYLMTLISLPVSTTASNILPCIEIGSHSRFCRTLISLTWCTVAGISDSFIVLTWIRSLSIWLSLGNDLINSPVVSVIGVSSTFANTWRGLISAVDSLIWWLGSFMSLLTGESCHAVLDWSWNLLGLWVTGVLLLLSSFFFLSCPPLLCFVPHLHISRASCSLLPALWGSRRG